MPSANAGTGLVRFDRWLAGLPAGLDSYPEACAKGSVVRNLLEHEPAAELAAKLPGPLRRYVTDPPMAGEWIPEAHLGGIIHAVADLRGMTEREVLAWARERNRALFESPAYRILMAVFSPASLLRFAGKRWENWHRGTRLEVGGVSDDGVRATLYFPEGLFDRLLLRVFGEAFAAALELSRARSPVVRVEAEAPGQATYLARW